VGRNDGGEQQRGGAEDAGCLPLRVQKSLPQVVGGDVRIDTAMRGGHLIRPGGSAPSLSVALSAMLNDKILEE